MTDLHGPVRKFVEAFSRLPSIGPRQATRLAFHLLRLGPDAIRDIREALDSLDDAKLCARCFFAHRNESPLCDICRDQSRDQRRIALVEKETDLLSLEAARAYRGRYFIMGNGSPPTGGGPRPDAVRVKRLAALERQIADEYGGRVDEIVLAFNPTTYGDVALADLMRRLRPLAETISRLGRGIPMGGEIEFA
ncbi:MAG: recombination protein RecR, partial [Candidatus Liptonbacteria bacterium]|nr:recombination protein RecR [Candidatus Liptonbacteria bacterium]